MRAVGRVAGVLVLAAMVHVAVLGVFLFANIVSEWLEEKPEVKVADVSPIAIETPPDPEPEREPVEEEPPPPDLSRPIPSVIPPLARPKSARAPVAGLTAESTVQGGSGPAFRTGAGLNFGSQSLAEQMLGPADSAQPKELVMTADAVDVPPKPAASNRPPKPPARAVKKQVSGFVVVRLLIDSDGGVRDLKILQAEPPGMFEEAVTEVVPSWRFTPASYNGQPVEIRVDQTLRFNLG